MLFMNDYDIALAVRLYTNPNSAKYKAVNILLAHKNVIDNNSDGWCSWAAPVNAAKKLMELIQSSNDVLQSQQHYELKKALTPLRSFYTRHPTLPRPDAWI